MPSRMTAPFGFLRVAAACPPVKLADPEGNVTQMLRVVAAAQERGVQVLLFPELSLTGYTASDLFFSLSTLVAGAERAVERLARETAKSSMVLVVGLPLAHEGRLFNTAAVMQGGKVLGLVPKSYIPGYKEYYEERWFSPARDAIAEVARFLGASAPFSPDLIFTLDSEPGVALGVEICEDLWAAVPPSSFHAVAGATVILNPSASNELVAKAEYRRELVKVQSGRAIAAYVYANAGVHESTTDVVFGGQLLVAENGVLLAEGERFKREGDLLVTDVDTERLMVERARQTSFAEGVHALARSHRRVALEPIPAPRPHRLARRLEVHPFVPDDPATLDIRCEEIFSIQTAGLARRLEHTRVKRAVLGLSGGLDSTLALLVAVRTFDLLGLRRDGVPKTLVRKLVGWVAGHETTGAERTVLQSILDTPVSPELVAPDEGDGEIAQRTEEIVGPYELHDFFLYALLRLGAGPRKTLFLAEQAFAGRYEPPAIRGWLKVFVTRFFEQQYKRSLMPDGPKVGSVALSPRGDWRMPSD